MSSINEEASESMLQIFSSTKSPALEVERRKTGSRVYVRSRSKEVKQQLDDLTLCLIFCSYI